MHLIGTSFNDIIFDHSNVPSDQEDDLKAYLDIMETGMKGQVENDALITNLAFVRQSPSPSEP